MKYRYLWIYSFVIIITVFTVLVSDPGKNGSNPGCSGGSCHSFKADQISVSTDGLQAQVSLPNIAQGDNVAGELVDSNGSVVSVVGPTNNNPFTLTATAPGTYLINAGYRRPNREWDSLSVTLTVTGIEPNVKPAVLSRFELYDNHPNPFNNETLIRFSLPKQELVQVKIININGQIVRNLVNNNLPAGEHRVRWDGRDNHGQLVASGLYLYQLISEDNQMTKRLILAK